jgi:hypothetical protein
MRLRQFASAIVLLGGGVLACSSGDRGADTPASDVSAICEHFVSCGVPDSLGAPLTQAKCEADNAGWIPGAGCVLAYEKAACADLYGEPPAPVIAACYPKCTTTTCSPDQKMITSCGNIGAATYDCKTSCERNGKTYSGTCGTTYGGQTSAGGPMCWCI